MKSQKPYLSVLQEKGFGKVVFSRANIGVYCTVSKHLLTLNPKFNLPYMFCSVHFG